MIKHPLIFLVSIILLLVAAGFAVNRVIFLQSARRVEGKITSIIGHDSSCGSRRARHPCTKFNAQVEYTPPEIGRIYKLEVPAGTAYGNFQSIEHSSRKLGQVVKVAYDGNAPATAYEDTFYGIWATPLQIMFYQLAVFWGSLGERRQRRGYS